jgi:uncharacterized protein (DUF1697 family)
VTRRVLLLRGINVGRNNRIRMPELVALLEATGCTGVSTYLQSGNALVDSDLPDDELTARVEQALADHGVPVRVLARSRTDLEALLATDPFTGRDLDPALLHVGFLSAAPDPARVAELDAAALLPEELVVRGREVWLWYARGVQETRLTRPLARLGVVVTARNARTVRALHDLLA